MFTNKRQNFSEKAKQDAVEYLRSCLPNEGCGIFIDDEFMPFENKSEEPGQEFIINDDKFDEYLIDDKIQAIIHSHNNFAHASYQDQLQQRALDIPFGIVNFKQGTATHFIFFGDGIKTEPLLLRPFFFGVFDCLSLTQDFLQENFGHRIPDPPRTVDYWSKEQSLFEDHVNQKNYPVEWINKNKAQPYDMLMYKMQGSKYINHIGCILKTGKVLHHFMNKVSCTFPPSYFQEFLVAAGRYDRDWEGEYD